MRYRLRTPLIVLAIAVAVSLIVGATTIELREQGEAIRDAYCLDWASAAIVQYMDDHQGRYPKDWNDLKLAFDKVTARDRSFSFEEVRSRVVIDFKINSGAPPAQFLWPTSGRNARWNSPDPDERIRARLSQQNIRE